MDTFVHIAVGAAVGSGVYEIIVSRNFPSLENAETANNKINIPAATSGILAGIASHLVTDAVPHGDYLVNHGLLLPNKYWPLREFIASLLIFGLIAVTTRGQLRWVALIAGLMGGLPDIESLLIGIRLIEKKQALFPTHNGLIPHGKNLGLKSLLVEYGSLLTSLGWFVFRSRIPQRREPS
ncbi:MAG: hypothetical protein HY863_09150 [Chloroflexi bacterium]|nr:hypothetical protein [Chloroflexota bacterium]